MVTLTPRLDAVFDKLHTCRAVADIGCDHAYIPIKAIEDGIAETAIATDLNQGPLDIAKANIEKHGLLDRIETRIGGGLKPLFAGEADQIIIAGMGGEVISDIIASDTRIAKSSGLILQPMNSQYELRKYLIKNGFMITGEDIATEGFKVYNIITARAGTQAEYENDFYYQLPPYLYSHRNFRALYDKKMREFSKVISGLSRSAECDSEKLSRYKFYLEEIKRI